MGDVYWREHNLVSSNGTKLENAIEDIRAHGDIALAAVRTGLPSKHLKMLVFYDGDDLKTLEVSMALHIAMREGKSNQKTYAKQLFISALSRHASVPEAVASQRWYSASFFRAERERDPVFEAEWDEALEIAVDKLRLEAWRRGAEGVDEPVIYLGGYCYHKDPETGEKKQITVKRYSDSLLTTLLKRYDPAFRERTGVDLTASVDGGLTKDAAVKALGALTEEELAVLTKLVDGIDESE
jgi:hypothetical protein